MQRIGIECIAEMKPDSIRPLRIRYHDTVLRENVVLKVDNLVSRDKKMTMPTMDQIRSTEYVFKCESFQENMKKSFTITFNAQSSRWYIYVEA